MTTATKPLSAPAQTMVDNLERHPVRAVMLARLQQMVDDGNDHDGTAKEVTDYFRPA